MIDKAKFYFLKYREAIVYIIFGGLTTIVYTIIYFFCRDFFSLSVGYSTNIAWFLSVIFAYITNKVWVFESKSLKLKIVAKEFIQFVYARLLSQGINYIIMNVGIKKLHISELLVLVMANVIVVLFNYFASKFLIFKKKER